MLIPRVSGRCCHRRLRSRALRSGLNAARVVSALVEQRLIRSSAGQCLGGSTGVASVELGDDGFRRSCVISAATGRVGCLDAYPKRACTVMASLVQRFDRRMVARVAGPAVHEPRALRAGP